MTNISETLPAPAVSTENHVGGAKSKKAHKKPAAKKPAAKKTSGKKGGALIDDVKNLAVPFAILLAKQGLQNLFDDKKKPKSDKKKPKSDKKTESSKKPSSSKRRTSIAGGSACTAGCGMKGGAAAGKRGAATIQTQFDNIAREIEQFLQKY